MDKLQTLTREQIADSIKSAYNETNSFLGLTTLEYLFEKGELTTEKLIETVSMYKEFIFGYTQTLLTADKEDTNHINTISNNLKNYSKELSCITTFISIISTIE